MPSIVEDYPSSFSQMCLSLIQHTISFHYSYWKNAAAFLYLLTLISSCLCDAFQVTVLLFNFMNSPQNLYHLPFYWGLHFNDHFSFPVPDTLQSSC